VSGHKTTLVTGGAGFIGANLVRRLLRDGHECHVLARASTPLWRLPTHGPSAVIHKVDLADLDGVRIVIDKIRPSTVFHLSAGGGHPYKSRERLAALQNTVRGTANLLACLRQTLPQRLVYTGSLFEHGRSDLPHEETDDTEPFGFRGTIKARATRLCRNFGCESGVPTTLLRPYTVYGPWEQPGRLVSRAICCSMSGMPMAVTKAKSARDYVFIDDVVDALLSAARVELCDAQVINIASGIETTNEELLAAVEAATGRVIPRSGEPYPANGREMEHCRVDINKARSILNWRPNTDLTEGLKLTARWLSEFPGPQYRV